MRVRGAGETPAVPGALEKVLLRACRVPAVPGALAAALLLVPGCDLGLRFRLPPPEERLTILPREATASARAILATSRYRGPGERVASSRNFLGAVVRFVNPYGEDQILFDLELQNDGPEPVTVLPAEAGLDTGARTLKALGLDRYKRAWPTYPVTDDEVAKDQAVAFTYVLRSILLRRQIMPGETVTGRLAFTAPAGARGPLELTLPVEDAAGKDVLRFAFRVEFPRGNI
ncbi:MAG: hypothetical protein FJZ01_21615 [Candidatus Sericytochromatia bacterium]|nr:hypothetical protein [Candidatus Tanganyikabacteria bacterium]